MARKELLNLLMIDNTQDYSRVLVDLLSHYYLNINVGFAYSKDGFLTILEKTWDIIIFKKAYDINFTDIIRILQNQKIEVSVISLVDDDENFGRNKEGLPRIINNCTVRSIPYSDTSQIVLATCILHDNVIVRREMSAINEILSEAEQRANVLIKNSKSAVAYIDEGIHIFVNATYAELFGFDSAEDLIGLPIVDLVAPTTDIEKFKQFLCRFDKGHRDNVEFKLEAKHREGDYFESKILLAAASFEGEPVTQVIIQPEVESDISKLTEKLAAAERQDSLTGLLNRQGFDERFSKYYQSIKQNNECGALLYIVVDGIGKINSVSGIKGIDLTVKRVANILSKSFANSDISRFSDHAFTVLMHNVQSKSEIKQLAEDVRQQVETLFIEVDSRTITTTLTIGGVFIEPTTLDDVTKLLDRATKTANKAYLDSDNVGNVSCFYEPSLDAKDSDSMLAEYLQMAISQNGFQLRYQSIYDIESDSATLYEVSVGLPLANGKLMRPEKFYPVAESYNIVEKIDRWVLINACRYLKHVRETIPEARLLVTLSSQTLISHSLPQMVAQLVKAVGGNPNVLTLQFYEADLLNYLLVAKRQFSAIKQTHSQVCIKGFGSTAKTFEIADYLQPSLVRLLPAYVNDLKSADNLRIVRSLVSQTNDHSIPVIMPFIESAATMSAAWRVGARYLQGNYLQSSSKDIILDDAREKE